MPSRSLEDAPSRCTSGVFMMYAGCCLKVPFRCAIVVPQTCLSDAPWKAVQTCPRFYVPVRCDLFLACRVSWNGDGSRLMSASDDRTVRVWRVNLTTAAQADTKSPGDVALQAGPVLYGHSARLWDCQFGQGILVTASEDCTARCVACHMMTHHPSTGIQAFTCTVMDLSCILIAVIERLN